MDDWVYAPWDNPKQKTWLAQILSVNDNRTYNLFYHDGDVRDNVPQNEIRRPTKRQLTDKLIDKKFFDEGDSTTTPRKKRFKKGEFVVFLRDVTRLGDEPSYWCEREVCGDNIQDKREIQRFYQNYVIKSVDKYDDE